MKKLIIGLIAINLTFMISSVSYAEETKVCAVEAWGKNIENIEKCNAGDVLLFSPSAKNLAVPQACVLNTITTAGGTIPSANTEASNYLSLTSLNNSADPFSENSNTACEGAQLGHQIDL